MFRRMMLLAVLMLCVGMVCAQQVPAAASAPVKVEYPQTKTVDVTDDYFGTKVADPYRWLEDENSAETKAWVEAENKVTFGYLEGIPERQAIKARLTELWNYERFGNPRKEGDHYFFTRNSGLQNQSVWYQVDSLQGEPRVLIDPNTLSSDGTVALGQMTWTDDGKLVAYGVQEAGSDWQEWHVMNALTGERLPDVIKWVKFSGTSWTKDGQGFFYSRYDEPKAETKMTGANYFQKLYYHRLGTPQAEDVLVYDRPDNKELGFGGQVSDDGNYLGITVFQGTDPKNRFYYKDLRQKDAPVVKLLDDFDAKYRHVGNIGPVFYFVTDLQAPRGRVIAIDLSHPERAHWKTVVPESKDAIDDVSLLDKDKLVVSYLHDAHALVSIFSAGDGKHLKDLELPGLGTVTGLNGKSTDTETFYTFTSYTNPATVYRYDFTTGKSTLFRQPKVAFDPSQYETKQVFYTSKDGTRVPMFLTYKKGIKLNGQNPTLLYGYGGFDIPLTPAFSVSNLVWMEMGGIYAVANLRGGSEYGEDWHQGGMKMHKQNVFDDFIAAAEWLIANHYTSTPKLAVLGRSNGGLLIGAVENQRPDLFGVCFPGVGVMDMLRFQKFTIGWAWVSDYGSSADSPEMFKYIYSYSPYHNIKPGKYPPTLTVTADHDDRVVPGHTFKYTARLQAAQTGDAPILVRIETRAGHGGGKPTTKIIEEVADEWAFAVKNLHWKVDLPTGKPAQSSGGEGK